MKERRMTSKRLGLRFSVDNYPFRYKTEFEDGRGAVMNISGGGCAVHQLTTPLAPEEKLLLILNLSEEDQPMEISAQVVRVDEKSTAVKFMQLSEENKARITKYFAMKQRQSS